MTIIDDGKKLIASSLGTAADPTARRNCRTTTEGSQTSELQQQLLPESAVTWRGADVLDGVTIEYVSVADVSNEERYRATSEATMHEIAAINEALRSDPEFLAPVVEKIDGKAVLRPNNPVSAWMYEDKPALRAWRTDLVPTAKALTALYNPEDAVLPTGEPIDARTRNYFIHVPDAVAIRTRAAIMSTIAARHMAPNGTTRWTSLACGAAIPVFRALDRERGGDVDVKLVDLDADALAHATELAANQGFREGVDFHLLRRHLIREMIATSSLVQEIGESSQDFVDMLGIFEYIPDEFHGVRSAAVFLQNAFRLVKPGGALVAANMLDTHPQLHLNQRGIGWPKIFPRSRAHLLRIISEAGISPEQVSMTIPEDGIYAVVEIRKPACPTRTSRHQEAVAELPLAPKNQLPYWRQLKAVRDFGAGLERLRDAGGPVTRIGLGPKWAMPPPSYWISRWAHPRSGCFSPSW